MRADARTSEIADLGNTEVFSFTPIFRLLLKVAVRGSRIMWFLPIFSRSDDAPTNERTDASAKLREHLVNVT